MNAQPFTPFPVRRDSVHFEVLKRNAQIRCHLRCVGRHLSRFQLDRILFHALGILRAIAA
jgi:hypothetical protein